MILSSDDALYAYQKIKDAYQSIGRIDDYFRVVKYDKVSNLPTPLFGMSMEDDMFQSYDMHPEDMNFRVDKPNSSSTFDDMLEMTSSFSNCPSPGKEMKLLVKETNTNTAVGFIRLGSPLINSKPRNNWLGGVPDLSVFNKRAIMGFVIVPIQPFGFNYLGGKLLSLICCSHEVREMLNKKYDTEMCLFETTSLYGNIKGTSQYDGLKPFLRYRGDTESKFLLTLPDFVYHDLLKWFIKRNDGEELIHRDASSRKLKTQTKMISIIKNSLKEHHPNLYTEFIQFIKSREDITTQKRFYMSDYGFANTREVLLGQTDTLIPNKENFDKFYLENMIQWWKRKAGNRYERLKEDGSVRTQLEVWKEESINDIDIIR
jgi:hypothetical protein